MYEVVGVRGRRERAFRCDFAARVDTVLDLSHFSYSHLRACFIFREFDSRCLRYSHYYYPEFSNLFFILHTAIIHIYRIYNFVG